MVHFHHFPWLIYKLPEVIFHVPPPGLLSNPAWGIHPKNGQGSVGECPWGRLETGCNRHPRLTSPWPQCCTQQTNDKQRAGLFKKKTNDRHNKSSNLSHNYKPTDLLVVHLGMFLNQRVGWKDIYGPPNGFRWNGWHQPDDQTILAPA